MTAPRVFISYSHDSSGHKDWVKNLASDLRAHGVDAFLDQWDLRPGQDVAAFMSDGVAKSDRVLMVCSENYVEKADDGVGGVGYERLIVTAEVVQSIDTVKFVPLLRENSQGNVPRFLGARRYIDFRDDAEYAASLDQLCRELLGAPSDKPPLGQNPFEGVPPKLKGPSRGVGATGQMKSGRALLEDDWFNLLASHADKGLRGAGLNGCMELRFALHDEINKSQSELLRAIQASEIRTFGWPIGITLESSPEFRPKPFQDGVRAEVSINRQNSSLDRDSYDYWAARNNGDFYLLQSLFEDRRAPNEIFFNTRIVRTTEAILFLRNYCRNLGVLDSAMASVRVSHRGLAGRVLASSNANRSLSLNAQSAADESQSEIVLQVGMIEEQLVEHVEKLLSPMFILFDFQEFHEAVYTDIVRRFERGEVT
jgi:hypothetical protein